MMMFDGLLIWAAILLQAVPTVQGFPSYQEVRADAVMRRAWQGRDSAVDRICNQQSRVVRIQAIDQRFIRLQQVYQRRFGTAWDDRGTISEGRLGAEAQRKSNDILSSKTTIQPECRASSSFAGAIGEYQNGVNAAEVELGNP